MQDWYNQENSPFKQGVDLPTISEIFHSFIQKLEEDTVEFEEHKLQNLFHKFENFKNHQQDNTMSKNGSSVDLQNSEKP